MASLEIDFDWYRDPEGYRLLPSEEVKPVPRNALAEVTVSAFSTIASPSWLAPRLVPLKPERIVRGGGDLQPYRPLERFEKLFHQFVKSARSAGGVLDFIDKFGPLTKRGLDPSVGESVPVVIQHAEMMSTILEALSWKGGVLTRALRGKPISLGPIETALIADPITGGLRMRLTVADLLTGLWVQLGQSLASGATMRVCEHCNMPFEVGPGTGRRLDAKFCSDDHRVAFNSLKRSKGEKG